MDGTSQGRERPVAQRAARRERRGRRPRGRPPLLVRRGARARAQRRCLPDRARPREVIVAAMRQLGPWATSRQRRGRGHGVARRMWRSRGLVVASVRLEPPARGRGLAVTSKPPRVGRFGLVFARHGAGVRGERTGGAATPSFVDVTMRAGRGTVLNEAIGTRYRWRCSLVRLHSFDSGVAQTVHRQRSKISLARATSLV